MHSTSSPQGFTLRCRGLSYTKGFTDIISRVDFSAHPGECIAILGPSGAGKSTILKMIAGYYSCSGGAILLNGSKLEDVYESVKNDLAYVPQDDLVHPSLSTIEEMTFAARLRLSPQLGEEEIQNRVSEVLKAVELKDRAHTKIKSLSGGQRKRVSMAVELLANPSLILLDEATSGLDPALEEKLMNLFRKLANQGKTLVLTTHVMDSVKLLDYILILKDGRLSFFGPPKVALSYFEVDGFSEIFKSLGARTAREWEELYRSSPLNEKYSKRARPCLETKDDLEPRVPSSSLKSKTRSIEEELEQLRREAKK